MHDIGVIVSGAGMSEYTRGDERLVFAPMPLLTPDEAATGTDSPEEVAQRILDHVIHGSRVVQELGLPATRSRASPRITSAGTAPATRTACAASKYR